MYCLHLCKRKNNLFKLIIIKEMNKGIQIGLGLAALFIVGCKVPQVLPTDATAHMPATFTHEYRDTSVAINQITVDKFFADEHLKTLIQKALADNLDYKIVLKKIDIAGAYLRKSKGALLPSINGLV